MWVEVLAQVDLSEDEDMELGNRRIRENMSPKRLPLRTKMMLVARVTATFVDDLFEQ